MKFVLGGPPQSGKSCLREGLKQAIRSMPGAPYPYIITGCPDGEGAWFSAAAENDPKLARELKEAYKAKFTPELARRIAESVAACALPLTLVDIGGRISLENRQICSPATHIVLLAGNCPKTGEPWRDRLVPWRRFAEELGLAVVAEIFSDYHGLEDAVEGPGPDCVLRGSVHHLERGEDISQRPMIRALAEHLVRLVAGEK